MASKYCAFCGAAITQNARFCSQCGKPVDAAPEDSDPDEAPAAQGEERETSQALEVYPSSDMADPRAGTDGYEYVFLGRRLRFDRSIQEYNAFQNQMDTITDQTLTYFFEHYESKVRDFETLITDGLAGLPVQIAEAENRCLKVLASYGVRVSTDQLLSYSHVDDLLQNRLRLYFDFMSEYDNIAKQLKSYRAAQRSGRSQWVGGGFGLKGALKGAMTAGMLNLGTNALRGIGDSVTDLSDKKKLKDIQQKFYSSRDHEEYMLVFLSDACHQFTQSVEAILKSRGILRRLPIRSDLALDCIQRAERKAKDYCYAPPRGEQEQIIDLLCKGLQYDPYGTSGELALRVCYLLPGTEKAEIHRFAKTFCFEKHYLCWRDDYIKERLIPVRNMPESTSAETVEKLLAYQKVLAWDSEYNGSDGEVKRLRQRQTRLAAEESNAARKAKHLADVKQAWEEIHSQLTEDEEKNTDILLMLAENGNGLAQSLLEDEFYDSLQLGRSSVITAAWRNAESLTGWLETASGDDLQQFLSWVEKLNENDQKRFLRQMERLQEYVSQDLPFALFLDSWLFIRGAVGQFSEETFNSRQMVMRLQWYRELAGQGNVVAMRICGTVFAKYPAGRNTMKLPPEQAAKYITESADAFDRNAMMFLSDSYRNGTNGFSNDEGLADEYYEACYAAVGQAPKPRKTASSSSGCFITSAVCNSLNKPDDCYELTAFRSFRDRWLSQQPDGKDMIEEYYRIAPKIVEQIDLRTDHAQIYRSIWENHLQPCLSAIEAEEYERCKHLYSAMVRTLDQTYLKPLTPVC